MEFRQQPLQVVEVFFREFAEQRADAADANRLVLLEGGAAFGRQDHVDFALIVRVDTARDKRLFTCLQGTDDPRHLGGQDTQLTLNVAHDQRLVMVQQRQRQKLDFLEVAGTPPAAR